MKLINIDCPNCGAGLSVTDNVKRVKCEYCEREFIIAPDEGQVKLSDAERTGYEFEKGRQRAIRETETEVNNFDKEFLYNEVPSYNVPSYEEPYVTERKPKKKYGCLRILLLVFAFIIVFSTFCGSDEKKKSEMGKDNNSSASVTAVQVAIPSDSLQKFFMELSLTTSPTDVEELIKKHSLIFKTLKRGGGTTSQGTLNYRIGKTDKAVSFLNDARGDCVEIEFDIGKNNSFMKAVYRNEKFTAANVLLFKYGYYYALGQHDDTNKEKQGYYYYNTFLGSLQFDKEQRSPYEKYNTAKEALMRMLTYKQKD